MNDMKLIMENWRKNVVQEEFSDCPTNNYKIYHMITAMGLLDFMDDKKKAVEKANKELQKMGQSSEGALKKVLGVLSLVGAGAAVVAPPAGAALAGGAGLVSAAAAFTGDWLEKLRDNKVREGNKAARAMMQLFCIDDPTLDLIDNGLETLYIHNSGVMDEIQNFMARGAEDPNLEFPDLTKHLIDWLNTQSTYKDSDASELEYKR